MSKDELNVLWQIANLTRINKSLQEMTQDDFAKWVARQLAESLQVYTHPVGASYFSPCDKSEYEKYVLQ